MQRLFVPLFLPAISGLSLASFVGVTPKGAVP